MSSTSADVQAVIQLMHHLKVEPEELLAATRPHNMVTFEQFMPLVLDPRTGQPTARHQKSYCNRIVSSWGSRRLDEPTVREVRDLIEHFRSTAARRRDHTDGSGAALNAYNALNSVYLFAMQEGVLSSRQNPMVWVTKPRQAKSKRQALSSQLVQEISRVAATTGHDPRLDSLLIRLHLETAARPSGARRLLLKDLDPTRLLITLREKGLERLQPVSRTLMDALLDHARERGVCDGEFRLLRNSDGTPVTQKRYYGLWDRLRKYIKAVDEGNITMYWLRHTTLTWVERNFGPAVARAFAGHAESHLWYGVTTRYVKAGLQEIATALQALTGEPHPLALPGSFVVQSSEILPAAVHAAPVRSELSGDQDRL
ncbi:tyrosine-type recombinase/integrase [Lentzea sp. NPDC102401]|uniref:tyrosine-type recombinase/integrase n=1 Tax=Lentzea sp. NPDC102401 TaxID=3364128 RepID=UPI003816C00C